MKKALVLSGGSVKGAFQAGAIKAVLESEFHPDIIYGISVGSLNGAYLANKAGEQNVPKDQVNWAQVGQNLWDFWLNKIDKPSRIVRKRNKVELGADILFGKFAGLVDTSALHQLVRDTINMDNLYQYQTIGKLVVGAVNIADGKIKYAEPHFPNFLDYVLASTAIPVMMPVVKIGSNSSQPFLDGGLRDVVPLKESVKAGATEIICILCQAEDLEGETFNYGNLLHLSERIMDVVVNETVRNDIEWAESFNPYLPADGTPAPPSSGYVVNYKKVDIKLIRPASGINLDILNFNKNDIEDLLKRGYQTAKSKLG